jgi:hypothetical protein
MCFIKQRSSRGTVVSRILGLHLNALALGVVDGPLYDALEEAMKLASNPC